MKSTVNFLLLFVILIPGCDYFTDPEEGSNSTEKIVLDNGIEYSLSVSKFEFSLRDSLVVSFRVKNNTLIPKKYNFANVQQLGFKLTNSLKRVALFHPVIVSPALSSFIVNPGKTKTLTTYTHFKDQNGNYISPGTYILTGYLLDRNSPELSLRISVK
ncbi:MAG: hypothetical protein R6W68_04085 [Ignavibacteriaceae bacterium]